MEAGSAPVAKCRMKTSSWKLDTLTTLDKTLDLMTSPRIGDGSTNSFSNLVSGRVQPLVRINVSRCDKLAFKLRENWPDDCRLG